MLFLEDVGGKRVKIDNDTFANAIESFWLEYQEEVEGMDEFIDWIRMECPDDGFYNDDEDDEE